mmetsp:Transcript_34248/g.79991  ORF Transcript_34248/g.79991 Transcript_34248/m.79991 type:complete len:196 (+) Transcript_34248:113-700(+)
MGNRPDCCVSCQTNPETAIEKAGGQPGVDGSAGSVVTKGTATHQRCAVTRVLPEDPDAAGDDAANFMASGEDGFATMAPYVAAFDQQPEEDFWVSVRRDGQKMGLSVALNPGLGYLRVGIVKADGVFAKWNKEHAEEPGKQITAHCFIKEVNGQASIHDMVHELRVANELSVHVVKLPPSATETKETAPAQTPAL